MFNPSLTPDQIFEFLDLGYLKIELSEALLGKDFAARMFERAQSAYTGADQTPQPGKRILHIADEGVDSLPEVRQLLSSRELNGALTSLLGRDFYRYQHSFIHRSDTVDQSFHKDSPLPWGTKGGIRSHKLEWAMAFYYPQDTTVALGPTEILPGTQYWNVDRLGSGNTKGEDRLGLEFDRGNVGSSSDLELRDKLLQAQWQSLDKCTEPLKLEVNAGTIVLVHFDLFHRGTRMNCEGERYMFKFWFTRTSEPEFAVRAKSASYQPQDFRREPIVSEIGSWMNLASNENQDGNELGDGAFHGVATSEPQRMYRAYRYARQNDECLVDEACSGIESTRRAAVYALATRSHLAKKAIPRLLDSDDVQDQQSAMFLIGECCRIDQPMVASAIDMTRNKEGDVARAAIIALGKMKRRQQSPMPERAHNALVDCLLEVLLAAQRHSSHRQLAYLSLLSFASDGHNALGPAHVARIEAAKNAETDKYARSTGNEVLARVDRVRLASSS